MLQKETKNPTIDLAKLQIKSEKPLLLEDFFRGRGAILTPHGLSKTFLSADTDTDSPKFRNSPLRGKRVKEKVYIYIYKYKNILLTFLCFSTPSQEERRGVRKIGLSVSVSARRHIKARS